LLHQKARRNFLDSYSPEKVQRILAQRSAMSNACAVDFIGKNLWYLTETSQRAASEKYL
jgi:hypothetical protein